MDRSSCQPVKPSLPFGRKASRFHVVIGLVFLSTTSFSFLLEAEDAEHLVAPAPESIWAEDPNTIRFVDQPDHPAQMYPVMPADVHTAEPKSERHAAFLDLLKIYERRSAVDDNFTLRVYDKRTSKHLEHVVLDEARYAFYRSGFANWKAVDSIRAETTDRLVRKYMRRGYPRKDISVRWGRVNQVLEARTREKALIHFEMQLARKHGLSLLATEIGTVETFNQDTLVSAVGARSRYQLMPAMLRQFGLHAYTLQTNEGVTLEVRDEWHPLLTMPAAFSIIKAYTNAVGHEIPGLSAYHTGPGNIFKVYNAFLAEKKQRPSAEENVLSAYIWGLTEGFDDLARSTSFGVHSQGYVPALYSSLRAVELLPVDETQTYRAEQLTLKPNTSLTLRSLLMTLEQADSLDWGHTADVETVYERLRLLNPHMRLPETWPASDDVAFKPRSRRTVSVKLFVPIGSHRILQANGFQGFDTEHIQRFDETTFADPAQTGDLKEIDRRYVAFVEKTAQFGFNEANRRELRQLYTEMRALAKAIPTPYRIEQAHIITLHYQMWGSRQWQTLARTLRNLG